MRVDRFDAAAIVVQGKAAVFTAEKTTEQIDSLLALLPKEQQGAFANEVWKLARGANRLADVPLETLVQVLRNVLGAGAQIDMVVTPNPDHHDGCR